MRYISSFFFLHFASFVFGNNKCILCCFSGDGGSDKFLVTLVDFGRSQKASLSDIGHLREINHQQFPTQAINLCLLTLAPRNKRNWDDDYTDYVSDLLLGMDSDEEFGNGTYEITVEWRKAPDLIFTSNLLTLQRNVKHQDYVNLIISKGIASNCIDGVKELIDHAMAIGPYEESSFHSN